MKMTKEWLIEGDYGFSPIKPMATGGDNGIITNAPIKPICIKETI